MSADRPSSAIRETDNPSPAPPPPQDKPAPQPRDNRTTAEYNRDAFARPPIQRRWDNNQRTARPDTGNPASNDAPPADSRRAADRMRGEASVPGARPQDKRAPHGMVSDLEHNRAVITGPPMQRRDNSNPASATQRPDTTGRAGTSNDSGTAHHSGADASTNRSADRTDAGPIHTEATRQQPEQQGDAEPRETSGQGAAPSARHALADGSGTSGERWSAAKADSVGTGQELNGPFSGSQDSADDGSLGPDAGVGGRDDHRDRLRDSDANIPQDRATASDEGKVIVLDRSQGDAQGGAPDSKGPEASRDSTPSSDRATSDETPWAADGPGPVPPDLPDRPADAPDHPDEPITKPESGTANSEAERQVLVGALARLERKDQEIDQLKTERDRAKAENDRLKAELDRFKAKETQPGDNQPQDKTYAEHAGSANIGESSSGLADRIQHKADQVTDKVTPEPKRLRLPSDKAVGLFVAASTGIDALAVNAHAISGATSTNIGIFTGVCAAAIMWGRERWENRRKNGR